MKRHLTWSLVLSFLTVASVCFAQGQKQTAGTKPTAVRPAKSGTAATSKATREELVALEKLDWEAMKGKDMKALDRLLSKDFVWVDDSGVVSGRAGVVDYLAGFDLADYSMEDVKFVMFSKGVALLTYQVTLKGSFKGEPFPSKPFYISSEYVTRGGKWINVFTQSTLAR